MKLLSILMLAVIFSSTAVLADQINVGGVAIEIPAPDGFSSITQEEAIFAAWQRDSHPSASTLAGFMSSDDYHAWKETRDFDWGDRNAVVEVDLGFQSLPATDLLFTAFKNKTKKLFSESIPKAFVDGARSTLNPDLQVDQTALVEIIDRPTSFTIMQVGKTDENDYKILATTNLLINQRIIGVELDAWYDGREDIDQLKQVTERWLEKIYAANQVGIAVSREEPYRGARYASLSRP